MFEHVQLGLWQIKCMHCAPQLLFENRTCFVDELYYLIILAATAMKKAHLKFQDSFKGLNFVKLMLENQSAGV